VALPLSTFATESARSGGLLAAQHSAATGGKADMSGRSGLAQCAAYDPQQTSDVQCNRCPVAEWLAYRYPLTDHRKFDILRSGPG